MRCKTDKVIQCKVRTGSKLLKNNLYVRQINGEKIFKLLFECCRITEYPNKIIDHQLSLKRDFIFVKEGEIFVYKIDLKTPKLKSLLRSYRAEEYCGFQDYPLFWNQMLSVEVSSNSTLITVPLCHFHRFFRRVVPMTYLQSKAEYLKKLPLFRSIELQKIFKLACLSQKYRIQKGEVFLKEGDPIDNVFIICCGKIELSSSSTSESIICSQNQNLLVKEIKQGINHCSFFAKCIYESDVLAIPREEFRKIFDIRYKLEETIEKQIEEREQGPVEDFVSSKQLMQKQKTRSNTLYTKPLYTRSKTEKSEFEVRENKSISELERKKTNLNKKRPLTQAAQIETCSPYTLGEIQLLKFIKRKQKIESRNFFKYIESRAPEIVLNPSKQFAIVKPLYKEKSRYVRNMKRKMKQSISMSNSVELSMHVQANNFLL